MSVKLLSLAEPIDVISIKSVVSSCVILAKLAKFNKSLSITLGNNVTWDPWTPVSVFISVTSLGTLFILSPCRCKNDL